ncbi:MAG: histidine phosphatase family protein [Candidatus Hydrogenedentes bacterium]|nr:histidine phosphatase family protein [Candidatus Hydrogenedentota bacterium]
MSELIIVRHGQASFMSGDYDRLSERGFDQARRLGRYWAAEDIAPTHLVIGPRKRQRQTAEAIQAAMAEEGVSTPEPVYDNRLDEFDWDGLFTYGNSTWSLKDARTGELKAQFEAAATVDEKRRTIHHYMEAVTLAWARDRFFEEGLETWAEFRGRVESAVLLHTRNAPRGSRVVFVTSGGVAAATAGFVLGLTPEKTLGLVWTLRNGALVEFVFSGGRYSLSSFNNAPHLPSRDLWTYR